MSHQVESLHARRPRDGITLVSLDWSGDFVTPGTRSSEGFRQGRIFTNAGLVGTETLVSIAIGLMQAGGHCRTLVVPAPDTEDATDYDRVRQALAIVGVALEFAGAR
jgi:hypothetical protein